ncbi:MAG: hypothetical protein ABS98_03315 [Lysobacteraceae bacterium SCN 69-48]|nr:MAG: hypothetical protein ABS98_03315 [Xanthomonadaceae bacterium SCN 69-48]
MNDKCEVSILARVQPPLRWEPQCGAATDEFLKRKMNSLSGPSEEELMVGEGSVLHEARRILGRCLPPSNTDGAEVGLVVGYVQSGKTLSFETVISLARDNSYGLVIVLAGTKTNLREQSEERLIKDLAVYERRHWRHFSNPTPSDTSKIRDGLAAWKRQPVRKQTVLITLLKQKNHLSNLAELLGALDLRGVPTLLIDDESDQASLNTNASMIKARRTASNAKSAVYNGLCEVRATLPHHSFLQYTATPQANLLLAQTDLLNPSFAELVTPGAGYTGGHSFFGGSNKLVVRIPDREIPSQNNQVRSVPASLTSALRFFLLAAAQHSLTKGDGCNRSMMIHPAMQTRPHRDYKDWIEKSFKTLKGMVRRGHDGNAAAVTALFQSEYDQLAETFPAIESLPDLISELAEEVLDWVEIAEINTSKDALKKVNWEAFPYWILVGGEKLGRGYTVEGLVVSYMPRPLGVAPNADTLQQRARFFGYRSNYLGLCRIFVPGDVHEAFVKYVEHERSVRGALEAHRGKALRAWRRDFILDSSMRATRANVIGIDSRRILVESWLNPSVLHRDPDAIAHNRALFGRLREDWGKEFGEVAVSHLDRFKGAKSLPRHSVIEGVPLSRVVEDFMLSVSIRDERDSEDHSAMLLALAALKDGDEALLVDVYLLNNLDAQYRSRRKGRGEEAESLNAPIGQYFSQSANSLNDKSFCTQDRISLQLRMFNVGQKARDEQNPDVKDVPWFALYVPKELQKHVHIETK